MYTHISCQGIGALSQVPATFWWDLKILMFNVKSSQGSDYKEANCNVLPNTLLLTSQIFSEKQKYYVETLKNPYRSWLSRLLQK